MTLLSPLPGPQAPTCEVVIALVDVVGSTALAHQLPLPHYTALMAEFVQVMMLSFEALEGQVLGHQGDAVLACWPAGGVLQACRAVSESHDRAARLGLARTLGVALQLHAGLASGPVIMGVVGGQTSAYGLPVNYARRLCDAAEPGDTLVCAGVAQAVTADRPLPLITAPLRAEPARQALRGFGMDCPVFRLSAPGGQMQHMKVD